MNELNEKPTLPIHGVTGSTGINVLSLFDGMSCGQIALDKLGIKVNNYFASEIDEKAIYITQKNSSEVYLEDCTKALKRFNDNHFDLAIVDPPYGIGADKAQNNAAMQRIKADGKSKAGRGWKLYADTDWDNETPNAEYWQELFRVSKNQIVWGGNYFTDYLPPSMGWIMWDKGQRDFSLADGELAWTSFNKALRIFEMSRGKALAKNNEQGGRFHPTQKPEMLYSWILQNYAKEGDLILDTHLGSGSSRIAAYKGGFNFVGFEINEHYYEKQEKRFKDFISQLRLF